MKPLVAKGEKWCIWGWWATFPLLLHLQYTIKRVIHLDQQSPCSTCSRCLLIQLNQSHHLGSKRGWNRQGIKTKNHVFILWDALYFALFHLIFSALCPRSMVCMSYIRPLQLTSYPSFSGIQALRKKKCCFLICLQRLQGHWFMQRKRLPGLSLAMHVCACSTLMCANVCKMHCSVNAKPPQPVQRGLHQTTDTHL